MRIISSIVFPLAVVIVQWFIRHISDVDFNTVGITLGAIGLGQIFPFIIYDTLIVGKVLSVRPYHSFTRSEFTTRHQFLLERDDQGIENLKKWTYLLFVVNLLLFMFTVYLGVTGELWTHITLGGVTCVISALYLLFA